MISPSPIQQHERNVIVDIIRGFALTGVLIANFTSYNQENVPPSVFEAISSPLDRALDNFNTVFFEWKFMTLFSILFGYGFGLILSSLEKKNIDPTPFFIRRMFWLFIFGSIHTLFWWGDVLHLYAMSGIFLLLFRKMSPKKILIASILFMFVLAPFVSYLLRNQPDYFTESNLNVLYHQYKYGSILDVMRGNATFYFKAFVVSGDDIHDVVETLGRFLFGYFLLRINLFEAVATKRNIFKKVLLIAGPIVVVYFIIRWLSLRGTVHTHGVLWEDLIKIGIISTSCFYASLLTILYISYSRMKLFAWLQALGKMTLTNYLLISAILVVVLYGIGFGKLGEVPMHIVWIWALGWLIIEIVFSTAWLRRFRYGPFEWIWRQLTYRKRIPIRKLAPA
jgi:uncharacterized protein